jgi:hypothetical protein
MKIYFGYKYLPRKFVIIKFDGGKKLGGVSGEIFQR